MKENNDEKMVFWTFCNVFLCLPIHFQVLKKQNIFINSRAYDPEEPGLG